MMNIISNCPLCEAKALHVIGEKEAKIQQCISCGYVTNSKYKGKKEESKEYIKLTEDMEKWAKEALNSIWIPTIMTLPDYMLYPFNDKDGLMKWGLAEMVDIPKEEQENYPIPDNSDKFYERKYDTDKAVVYEKFYEALSFINEKSKQKIENQKNYIQDNKKHINSPSGEYKKEIKLPKFKNKDK